VILQVFEEAPILPDDRELIARSLSQFRRTLVREFFFDFIRVFGDFDFSLPQLATLLLLDEEDELTITQVAELLGRSVSVASRLLDQLVVRGMVRRREDERDRRVKRVAITEQGRTLVATLEQQRANAQLAVMASLSPEEQAEVTRAMALLAQASRRRKPYESSEQ
jgi:DNA-binding MarR family transcriptional regulator